MNNTKHNDLHNVIKTPLVNKTVMLLNLIEKIPHWETHLTDKQLEVTREFIVRMNVNEVDHQLKLKSGTSQNRIFGNNSTNKGAIGKLTDVASKLDNSGYFKKIEKIQVVHTEITMDIMEKTREFFRLIVEIPDYKLYLDQTQNKFVFEFMRLRNYANTAKYFGMKESTFINHLLGDHNGILIKLREIANTTMVSNWDEIN